MDGTDHYSLANLMLKCQLRKLINQKRLQDDKRITLRDIQEATGVQASTLSRMAKNKMTRFESKTLCALCKYFCCSVGDLLVYEDEDAPT
jgi:putative transcriptional regulator